MTQATKTGWPMGPLMQDDHRGLFQWFAEKLGSRVLVREAGLAISMTKFVSDWHKDVNKYTFPEGMPNALREHAIWLRRRILAICYIHNGVQEELVPVSVMNRLARELENLQAVWGCKFGFYDCLFDRWDISQEDHLITNNGVDSGVVNYALKMLQIKKAADRRKAF